MQHEARPGTGGAWSVALSGALGEGSGEALLELAKTIASAREVVFDCAGIQRINSLGAGRWIEFLRALPATLSYRFETCPPVFIGYVNAVRPFRGKGAVASFQIPWHCASCDRSFLVTARAQEARAAHEKTSCKTCGRGAAPETDLDYYLGFLD